MDNDDSDDKRDEESVSAAQHKRRARSINAENEAETSYETRYAVLRVQNEMMREHKDELAKKDAEHKREIADKDKQLNGFIDAINRNTNTLTNLASGIFSLKNVLIGAGNQLNNNVLKLSNDIKDMESATKMIADAAKESGREMTVALSNVTRRATTRRDRQTHGAAALYDTAADRPVLYVVVGLEETVKRKTNKRLSEGYCIHREFQPVSNPKDFIANLQTHINKHNNNLQQMNDRTNEIVVWRSVTESNLIALRFLLPTTAPPSNALDLYTRAENETRVHESSFDFSAIDDRLADVDTLRSKMNARVHDLQLEHNATADVTTEMAEQLAQLALDCILQQPVLLRNND